MIYQKEILDGIKIIRVWTYIAKNKGFFRRSIDQFSYAFNSLIAGIFLDFDIIIATSPSFFTTWSAFFLSKIKKKPWVFELRDIWPKSINSLKVMKKGFLLNLLENIELILYKDCDLIIPVTSSFKTYLIKKGIDESKIHVVTNGVNHDFFKAGKADQKLVKQLNLTDKVIIGYFGTVGMAHSIDFVVKTISKLSSKNISLLIVGSGAMRDEIEHLIKSQGFKNIVMLPSMKKDKLLKYMSIIDFAIVPLIKSEAFKEVLPSKIFEAAALEKPIILGVEGEAKEMILKYNAGICYIPEDENSLTTVIDKLVENNKLIVDYKSGCNKLSSDFNRKKLSQHMYSILLKFYTEN